jgi:hypothetical protein
VALIHFRVTSNRIALDKTFSGTLPQWLFLRQLCYAKMKLQQPSE